MGVADKVFQRLGLCGMHEAEAFLLGCQVFYVVGTMKYSFYL